VEHLPHVPADTDGLRGTRHEARLRSGDEKWLPTRQITPRAKADEPEDWMLPYGYRLKDNRIERHIEPKNKKGKDDETRMTRTT